MHRIKKHFRLATHPQTDKAIDPVTYKWLHYDHVTSTWQRPDDFTERRVILHNPLVLKMFRSFTRLRYKHSVLNYLRKLHTNDAAESAESSVILGIETSCDDTAVGVVDGRCRVLAESAHSQLATHIEYGGIIPPIARDLHRDNIGHVVQEALKQCPVPVEDMSAVAVTVRPGMSLSLLVGLNFARELASKYGKPLIPIHHMEAHALVVRLVER